MNINERMATEVMGWHLGTWLNKNDAWYSDIEGKEISEFSEFEYYVHTEEKAVRFTTWHPDTDIGQAMMCADKLLDGQRYIKYSADKWIGGTGIECAMYFVDLDGKWVGGIVKDTIPLAICEAILEALEKEYNR